MLDAPWPTLSHHEARGLFYADGWRDCGAGDWAYVLRSPDGLLAARISPFEPAYAWFVELCRRCAGNRYLPRVEQASPLEGGGHIAVLEYLHPVPEEVDAAFVQRWDAPDDEELAALRAAVDELRAEVAGPWNVRVDVGENVMRADDGQLKVVDLLYVGGHDLLQTLLTDPETFRRELPPERRRYLLDLPHFTRDYAAGDLARFRAALARL